MHNRISYNQLASWLNREQSLNSSIEQTDLVNDYFDCLIECDDDQATCKRYCKTLLMWLTTPERGFFNKYLFKPVKILMNDKKAAKKIIRIAKTRPDLYSKADVVYARIIKKRIKQEELTVEKK